MKRALSNLTILVAALAAPLARADIVYTYTGTPFTTSIGGVYSATDSISGFFTLTSALGSNFSFQSIIPKTFSFTDQHQTFTDATPLLTPAFQVSTDAAGNINEWEVNILSNLGIPPLTEFLTQNLGINGADAAVTTDALGNILSVGNVPVVGGWAITNTTAVPEPNSLYLLVVGALGIALVARKQFSGRMLQHIS